MKANINLISEIKQLKESILAAPRNGSEVAQSIKELEKILLRNSFTKEEEIEILDIFETSLHQFYEKHFFVPTISLEKKFLAEAIRDKKFDARKVQTRNLLFNGATALLKEEIKYCKIKPTDTVAIIGSGPFPLSALVYHKFSNATIHCIEKNESACADSRRLLRELGLASKIQVIHACGEEIQDQNYALASLVTQAYPKDAILDNLATILRPRTQVVVRVQSGLGSVFTQSDDSISQSVFDKFKPIHTISRKDNMMRSCINIVR